MTFASRIAKRYPGHDARPNEKDITFARPGNEGFFAPAGREVHRSGLKRK
jgi:hypothetical protein